MKAGPDRKYTVEFREAAVRPVLDGGRSVPQVARALEMSAKTLANWVMKARKGQPLLKRAPTQPVNDLQAENARLRQENARLKLEKEILKEIAACPKGDTDRLAQLESIRKDLATMGGPPALPGRQ
jgi:transposase